MRRLKIIRNHLSSKQTISQFKSDLIKIESHNEQIKIVRMTNLSNLNSLSVELLDNLYIALTILNRDEKTKVIILTGNEKVFCAGADVSYLSKISYSEIVNYDYLKNIERISYEISKPLIAAVSGFCLGGGFELALACDIIGCTKISKFGFPEIKLGLFPGAGGTQRLSRVAGYYKACEVIFSGDIMDSETVKKMNAVNFIYDDYETLMKNTLLLAEKIAGYSAIAVKTSKKAIKASMETSLREGIEAERNIFYGLFNTQDKEIGTKAFLNKIKKPVFVDK